MNPRNKTRTASRVLRDFYSLLDASSLTHDDIAEAAGASLMSLWRWRGGKSSPKVVDLENMAQVLGYRVVLVKEGSDASARGC